jgi:Type IV secretion system pilin
MISAFLLPTLMHSSVFGDAQVACGNGATCPTGLPTVKATSQNLQNGLAALFAILGVLAVVMVVVGGFQLVMSQGDPQAAGRARMTVIYAVIGLAIAISAEGIIGFVLGKF